MFSLFGLQKWSPHRAFFTTFSKTPILWKSLFFLRKIAIFQASRLQKSTKHRCRNAFEKSIEKKTPKNRCWPPSWPPKAFKNPAKTEKTWKKKHSKKHMKKILLEKCGVLWSTLADRTKPTLVVPFSGPLEMHSSALRRRPPAEPLPEPTTLGI